MNYPLHNASLSRVYADKKTSFRSLHFPSEVEIKFLTELGTPYVRRIPVGMPKIPSDILNSVFYLYDSEKAAREGQDFGGTGFFVGVSSRHQGRHHVYGVSNRHVAAGICLQNSRE